VFNNTSVPVGDSGEVFGARFDPYLSGRIRLGSLLAGGGKSSSSSGLGLVFGQTVWPTATVNDNYQAGLGASSDDPPATDNRGGFVSANTAHKSASYVVDIVDLNSQRWALLGFNGAAASKTSNASDGADGSGQGTKFHALWASVYTANGQTASTLPAPVSDWTGASLSASVLNGNTGIRDVLRFLNYPPLLRVTANGAAAQNLTSGVANTIGYQSTTYDTYGGMNLGTNTYTVARSGLYLFYGVVNCNNFSGSFRVGALINGSPYWGPRGLMPGSGNGGASKVQVFSLNAGDTVAMQAQPTAAAVTSTGNPSRMILLYLGKQGTPSPLPVTPDTSYRWIAGTPGDLAPAFNAHLANDLNFLVQRPYLMAYQTVTQSGIAMSTETKVTMDTVGGIVHSDGGDNYSGWDSTNKRYVCQRAGWYLAVEEVALAVPTLTTSPTSAVVMQLNPHGTSAWDYYQEQNMTSASNGPGAGGIALYYLRAGDTITPGVWTADSSATTISTNVSGTAVNSHFELVWLGE
jgi:hypothetical protein